MTPPPTIGSGARLAFMSPLSEERANRIVATVAARSPATVADLGCGWGELLLRILAAAPGATGIGADAHGPDIVRARTNAEARGLTGRVSFAEGPARAHLRAADVVLNIGAYQAFGTIADALRVLSELVTPGGVLIFGAEFWEQPPTADRLAHMWPGASPDDCTDLAGLVDEAVAAGFRPLRIETATANEWEDFESGLAAEAEDWIVSHAGHPEAEALREKLDTQRDMWLKGHRGHLGFAYLTLAPHRPPSGQAFPVGSPQQPAAPR
ncbi:SAM-dependent methyltransferase [Actinoplanes sp. URMC 104]|uniref:SAM-dependent methyltransferase n=1 Tax=Actinoplanes sp. URMC 104 TaxID=3423409 RepID=UPI003F1A6965